MTAGRTAWTSGTVFMVFIFGYWAGREGFFDDLWTKAASVGESNE